MSEMDSISKVQTAEQKAKETIAKAQADGQAKISTAKRKAQEILSDCEKEILSMREKAQKDAASQVESYKAGESKRISSISARISKIKISNAELSRIAEEVAKDILS
jgi:vacuolar-type H+-ATPase subunit H